MDIGRRSSSGSCSSWGPGHKHRACLWHSGESGGVRHVEPWPSGLMKQRHLLVCPAPALCKPSGSFWILLVLEWDRPAHGLRMRGQTLLLVQGPKISTMCRRREEKCSLVPNEQKLVLLGSDSSACIWIYFHHLLVVWLWESYLTSPL